MSDWLIYPAVAAFLWASVNHLDKYILSKYCKEREVGGLVIFSGLIAVPILLLLLLIDPNIILGKSIESIIFVVLSGACYIAAIIPYLYALDTDDVSTVAPQMILIPVISAIFAYIFLSETLTFIQLLGTCITIIGSILISLDIRDVLKTRFKSRVFFLMLISSVFMSLNVFFFRYAAVAEDFISEVFWLHLGYLLITIIIFIFIKSYRQQFIKLIKINPKGIISINFISEVTTIGGNLLVHYATLLAPIALVEVAVEGIQPFFVLAISIIITVFHPSLGKEHLNYKETFLKLGAITLMAIGIILINIS